MCTSEVTSARKGVWYLWNRRGKREADVSEGREIPVCPDEEGCNSCCFHCLEVKTPSGQACRDNFSLLCFLLQTLLSHTGFDKTEARQAGKLPQKQKSQEIFYSEKSFPRLVTYFKIVSDRPQQQKGEKQQNYLFFPLAGSSALGDGSADSFRKQYSKHDSFSFIEIALFPGNSSLPAPISKAPALDWPLAQVPWHRHPPCLGLHLILKSPIA